MTLTKEKNVKAAKIQWRNNVKKPMMMKWKHKRQILRFCKCGSQSHVRTTHHTCPLKNKRYITSHQRNYLNASSVSSFIEDTAAEILSNATAPIPAKILSTAVYTEEKVKKVVASTSTAYVEERTNKRIDQITVLVLARSNATSKAVTAIHKAHEAMLPAMKNYFSAIRSVQESSFESVKKAMDMMFCNQSRLHEFFNSANDFYAANATHFVMREFMKLVGCV